MSKSFYQPVISAALLLLMTAALNAQSIEKSVVAGGGGTSTDAGNTFSVTGVAGQPVTESSSGGSFTVKSGFYTAAPLGPTAATVTVSGKIMTSDGRGIRNVVVMMTDSSGAVRTATSTSFGYFHFSDVFPGATYTFSVRAKRFTFNRPAQVRSVVEEISDLNFVAEESNR